MPLPIFSSGADMTGGSARHDDLALQSPHACAQAQDSSAKKIKGKRFGKARLRKNLNKAGEKVLHACVKFANNTEARLLKPLHKAVAAAAHLNLNVEPLVYRESIVANGPVTSKSVRRAAAVAPRKDTQELDAIVASLKQHKITLKMAQPPMDKALKKLSSMEAAASKRQAEAQKSMDKNIPDLCASLPALRRELDERSHGDGPDVLERLGETVGRWTGVRTDSPLKKVTAAVDALWESARTDAYAAAVKSDLSHRREEIHRGGFLKAAIDQSRRLIDRADGLRRAAHANLRPLAEELATFERGHMEAFNAAKAAADALPDLGKKNRHANLLHLAGVADPPSSEITQVLTTRAAGLMSKLSNQSFDDLRAALAPGGMVETRLLSGESANRGETLDALRDALDREWVRRYESAPLSALARLTDMIESRADLSMLNSGRPISEMSLPDENAQPYKDAQIALNNLLRGMCQSRGTQGRTEYLSSLIFKSDHASYRVSLIENRAWKDPEVFKALMGRILRAVPNGEVMKPQYLRLMQEIELIVNRNALAPGEPTRDQRTRPLSDFDDLLNAQRGKSQRGAFWRAWDKVAFWSKYFVFKDDIAMEGARLKYHQAHVEKRLRAMLDVFSRDKPDPLHVQHAYRRFLEVADDLRVEYEARQNSGAAYRDYLCAEFSRAASRLGTKAVKNVYKTLQEQCPDMRAPEPRVSLLARLGSQWRNAFYDGQRATPRHEAKWQRMAERHWAELKSTVEQEPEARVYTKRLADLASKFDRDHHKDYAGMKLALDGIIQSDGNTWISPCAGAFTAYEAAWDRVDRNLGKKLLERLNKYADNMDEFLKFDPNANPIAEENRFMYSYILEGLRVSGHAASTRTSTKRHADRRASLSVPNDEAGALPV